MTPYVWLVVNANDQAVSVCDDEVGAKAIAARVDGRVHRWAIRHVPRDVTYCWRSGECVLPGGHDEPCSWGIDPEDEDD